MSTQALTALVKKLQDDKHKFLGELKSSVKENVASKKTEDCLIVVTKPVFNQKAAGVKWYWNDGIPYIERLISFLKQENYRNNGSTYTVDSILTEEIATIVANNFSRLYKNKSELIAQYAVAHILENHKIANALIETLIENSQITRYAREKIKHQMRDILLNGLFSQTEQIQNQIGHSIAVGTGKVTAAIVSSQLAAAVSTAASSAMGKVLVKQIAIYVVKNIGAIAAKMMAVPVIKTLVMKFAAAAIIGAFVKFIVVKTGISIGSAVVIVLLPILGAVLIHEWMNFPENLGESISSSICKELDTNFAKTNKEALSNVFQELLENQVEAIGKHLADDEEVSEKIGEVLSFLHA